MGDLRQLLRQKVARSVKHPQPRSPTQSRALSPVSPGSGVPASSLESDLRVCGESQGHLESTCQTSRPDSALTCKRSQSCACVGCTGAFGLTAVGPSAPGADDLVPGLCLSRPFTSLGPLGRSQGAFPARPPWGAVLVLSLSHRWGHGG